MLKTAFHEFTHVSEHSTKEYVELREAVTKIIGEGAWKEEVKNQLRSFKRNNPDKYNSMTKEERIEYASKEALAEACTALVEDSNLLLKMANDNPSIGEKIINKIKEVISKIRKMLKLEGTMDVEIARVLKENADNLQDIVDKWDTAVMEGLKNQNAKQAVKETSEQKNNTANYGVQYLARDNEYGIDIEDVKNLQTIAKTSGKISINDFTSEQIKKTEKWARKFHKELGTKSPYFRAWFGDWRANDNRKVNLINLKNNQENQRGTVVNLDTDFSIDISKVGIDHIKTHFHKSDFSQYVIASLKEIIENAILLDSCISESNSKTKNKNTSIMHSFYIPVKYDSSNVILKIYVEEFYNEWNGKIQKRAYDAKKIETFSDADRFGDDTSTPLYASRNVSINTVSNLHALVKQYDKKFNPKSVIPVLLNEDGTPKVFYHGTNKTFTEFKPEEIAQREGSFFFAENREDALAYGNNIYEVYLTGEKLADYDNQQSEFYKLKNKSEQVEYLKKQGYDGWYADMDSEGWGEISVFNPTQIKSATDNIGTFDGSNPDIQYDIGRGKMLTENQLIAQAENKVNQVPVFDDLLEDDLDFDITDEKDKARFNQLMRDDPEQALDMVYKSYADTIEHTLSDNRNIILEDKIFNAISQKILRNYSIEQSQKDTLTNNLRAFVRSVQSGNDFTKAFEEFISNCKSSLYFSSFLIIKIIYRINGEKYFRCVRLIFVIIFF